MHLQTYSYEFCGQGMEETTDHLFLRCPFAQQCWGLINLIVSDNAGMKENCESFKIQLNTQFFMVAFILMAWTIWLARNELIFNNNQWNLQDCRNCFSKEVNLIRLRVKSSLSVQFDQWLQSLDLI
jgi:hypothetical protein